jgi:hypothetical protein
MTTSSRRRERILYLALAEPTITYHGPLQRKLGFTCNFSTTGAAPPRSLQGRVPKAQGGAASRTRQFMYLTQERHIATKSGQCELSGYEYRRYRSPPEITGLPSRLKHETRRQECHGEKHKDR